MENAKFLTRDTFNHDLADMVFNQFTSKYGMYKYDRDIDELSITENLPRLTGKTYSEFKKIVDVVMRNIDTENANKEEITEYVTQNGKSVRVTRFYYNKVYYGFIEDITEIKQRERILLEKLKEAKEISSQDTLTGLYNRHILKQIIPDGNITDCTIILIDLDNFKLVNDIYGHNKGDELLKLIACIMRQCFRTSDVRIRLGGDEFMIYLPNNISEKLLRSRVEALFSLVNEGFKPYRPSTNVSMSVGCILCTGVHKDFESVYEMADRVMYTVKHKGKNNYRIVYDYEDI